jgi:hypothetical protein
MNKEIPEAEKNVAEEPKTTESTFAEMVGNAKSGTEKVKTYEEQNAEAQEAHKQNGTRRREVRAAYDKLERMKVQAQSGEITHMWSQEKFSEEINKLDQEMIKLNEEDQDIKRKNPHSSFSD